jgi:predicted nucleic acid-binding protein
VDWLLDTNVLLRLAQPTHPTHREALEALDRLLARDDRVCVVLQNVIEFWSTATRPVEANGIGYSQSEAEEELRKIETLFTRLPELPEFYVQWRILVTTHAVSGKKVHDTRLVAAMLAHGVTQYTSPHIQRSGLHTLRPNSSLSAKRCPRRLSRLN